MKIIKKNVLKRFLFICLGLIITTIALANVRVIDIPSPPGKPEVIYCGKDYCAIKWTPPTHNGGSPVTHYLVQMRYEGRSDWEYMTGNEIKITSCIISGLIYKSRVSFRVQAVNIAGPSSQSPPSELIKIMD